MKMTRFGQKRIAFGLMLMTCILLTGCSSGHARENGTESTILPSATASPSITVEGENTSPGSMDYSSEESNPYDKLTETPVITVPQDNTGMSEIIGVPEDNETSQITESSKNTQEKSESTASRIQKVKDLVARMTLEEKVGQMFFVRYNKDTAFEDIESYHVSGFLLFGADFKEETPKSITEQMKKLQEASEYPLIIGVDEEGGTVNRVSCYTQFRDTPFLSPQKLYGQGGFDLIVSDTEEKAKLLLGLGINMNLAPVCDVTKSSSDYMYQRSFGKSVEDTARYVKAVVETMKEQEILSVLKHFPGYGSNGNTHKDICVDKRSYETFLEEDFLPFQAGIDAGADAVLVSHNVVNCMDPDMPASLSAKVHEILREELGFNGVIMTDDLVMEAITQYTNGDAAAIDAVKAGNDLLIASDYQTQIPAVLEAVQSGEIVEDTIDQAVIRVLMMKWKQNGIEQE